MSLRDWLRRRFRSEVVTEAMEGSKLRAEEARAFRVEIERTVDPLRPVIRQNNFEASVRATFMRRPV